MAIYQPFAILCSGRTIPSAYEKSCQQMLDRMPVTKTPITFGPIPSESTVNLPLVLTSRKFVFDLFIQFPALYHVYCISLCANQRKAADQRCSMSIQTTSLSDTFSWYQAWEAGVALTGMCVRQGRCGSRGLLGRLSQCQIGKERVLHVDGFNIQDQIRA